MKRQAGIIALVVAVLGVASAVWALSTTVGPDEKLSSPQIKWAKTGKTVRVWPEGMEEVVNSPGRMWGTEATDGVMLFYRGNTAGFNDFLGKYASVKQAPLELVLHVGPKKAAIDGMAGKDYGEANWLLTVEAPWVIDGNPGEDVAGKTWTRIDLWLGGQIRLDELLVPMNVVVKSGGEIEKFVAEHERERKEPREAK
jgi:hypothetical protein